MYEGEQLLYGQVKGGNQGFDAVVAAGQTIKSKSGKFVIRTGAATATVTIAGATHTDILGHLEIEEFVTASTLGTEVRRVITDPTATYRLPVIGTYAATMKGKTCDLVVSSNIQYAVVNSSLIDCLIIEDGDADNNKWVDVRLSIVKTGVGLTGVV